MTLTNHNSGNTGSPVQHSSVWPWTALPMSTHVPCILTCFSLDYLEMMNMWTVVWVSAVMWIQDLNVELKAFINIWLFFTLLNLRFMNLDSCSRWFFFLSLSLLWPNWHKSLCVKTCLAIYRFFLLKSQISSLSGIFSVNQMWQLSWLWETGHWSTCCIHLHFTAM